MKLVWVAIQFFDFNNKKREFNDLCLLYLKVYIILIFKSISIDKQILIWTFLKWHSAKNSIEMLKVTERNSLSIWIFFITEKVNRIDMRRLIVTNCYIHFQPNAQSINCFMLSLNYGKKIFINGMQLKIEHLIDMAFISVFYFQ